jgi:hypothetical protein
MTFMRLMIVETVLKGYYMYLVDVVTITSTWCIEYPLCNEPNRGIHTTCIFSSSNHHLPIGISDFRDKTKQDGVTFLDHGNRRDFV